MSKTVKSYPSDVTDHEWEFVVSYLTLVTEDAPQREYAPRDVFKALRYVVKTGCQWRYLPNDFPPWTVVYQQARRRVAVKVFEAIAHALRLVVRLNDDRSEHPSAIILDARTLKPNPESGGRAGYDGGKRRKGSKVHAAVDTLSNLLAMLVTPANKQDRAQVEEFAKRVQEVTEQSVELAFVDQGYTGGTAASQAKTASIKLEVVIQTEAKRGFGLLPSAMGRENCQQIIKKLNVAATF